MLRRLGCLLTAFFLFILPSGAKSVPAEDFSDAVHTVDSLYREKCACSKTVLQLEEVRSRGRFLDFYFTGSLGDFPVRPGDEGWLKDKIEQNMPPGYASSTVGHIYCDNRSIALLPVPETGNDGIARKTSYSTRDKRGNSVVRSGRYYGRGLSGRNIAIWQSHGCYFNLAQGKWMWQRPYVFGTVEDLYTQGYVVPFLAPMLENAGAFVTLPRERDWNTSEIIIDNDPSENCSDRIHGSFRTTGRWQKVRTGFADTCRVLCDTGNPFENGTALKTSCSRKTGEERVATWSADIPHRGEYAVYVTYQSFPGSCPSAKYTVHSMGCDIEVEVDQRKGGGGWIYIGTFEFDSGMQDLVSLSSAAASDGTVCADAVRIGGGMGSIARGDKKLTSGRPRFAEGARYFLQWSGMPEKVWSLNGRKDDYRDDLMCRGAWVSYLSGGSSANPLKKGLGIPIDLSLAFHTDSGKSPEDDIIGTLSIYTLTCRKSARLPNGCSRRTCRELADFVQSQVVDDIRAGWDSLWTRRMLWNRSYSESRTTSVPAVLLELLSHLNFEDMKYGMDPKFRFDVSRACYKGILKYLSLHYGCAYTVQPLPVSGFSAAAGFSSDGEACARLSWKATPDTLEPTAMPSAYLVYTRTDGKGWDAGVRVNGTRFETAVKPGHIYSFKIVAENDGGRSFPSEILSVGLSGPDARNVLVVNNFNRISGPVWTDVPGHKGFAVKSDSGVPYIRDWTAAGNSFDYPYIHGLSILAAGYNFSSCSAESFTEDASLWNKCCAIDLICGKECMVRTGNRSGVRGGVFPKNMRDALTACTGAGCNVMLSGSYIARDVFGSVYQPDDNIPERKERQDFVRNVLGYGFLSSSAAGDGRVAAVDGSVGEVGFPVSPCKESYCVESPDALSALGLGSQVYMIYADSGMAAAVRISHPEYKIAAFGFPLELTDSEESRNAIFRNTLKFFEKR